MRPARHQHRLRLARALGLDDPLLNPAPDGGADPAATFAAAVDWVFQPSGMTVAELAKHPGGMPVRDPLPAPDRQYLERGFPTPSGKMEFVSSVLERLGPRIGADALPPGARRAGAPRPGRRPATMRSSSTPGRACRCSSTRAPTSTAWTRGLRPRPAADLNPADARALGIAQDDRVELSTPSGSIRVLANLTELARPGVVHMYHGHPEADVNLLLDPDELDPICGLSGLPVGACRIEKVRAEAVTS